MRFLELFLTILVSAVAITAGLPHNKCNKEEGCHLVIDPQLKPHQQIDAIAEALNNDVLGILYANMTATYDYSSGNQGTVTETLEETFELIGESYFGSTYLVSITKGTDDYGNEYDLAAIVHSQVTFSMNDGVAHISEEGVGATYHKLEEGGNYTFTGNITVNGGGVWIEHNSTVSSYASGAFEAIYDEHTVTTNAIAIDVTQVISGDRAYVKGVENIITDLIVRTDGDYIKPLPWKEIVDRNARNSQGSNYLSNTYFTVDEESPIPGQSGEVTERSTGVFETPEGEFTFDSLANGYELFEGSLKNNIPRILWRRTPRFYKL